MIDDGYKRQLECDLLNMKLRTEALRQQLLHKLIELADERIRKEISR